MNSLIKAMLSLDRRSKSVDDRKRGGGVGGGDEATSKTANKNKLEKQASFEKGTRKKNQQKQKSNKAQQQSNQQQSGGAKSSPKFLEIPSIRYNLISKSFEEIGSTNTDLLFNDCNNTNTANTTNMTTSSSTPATAAASMDSESGISSPPLQAVEAGGESSSPKLTSPPLTPRQQMDRASRISFFRFSKIGRHIRKKLTSSSGGANETPSKANPTSSGVKRGRSCEDDADVDQDCMIDVDDPDEEVCVVQMRSKSAATSPNRLFIRSANASFESRVLPGFPGAEQSPLPPPADLRRAHSSSPISFSRINASSEITTLQSDYVTSDNVHLFKGQHVQIVQRLNNDLCLVQLLNNLELSSPTSTMSSVNSKQQQQPSTPQQSQQVIEVQIPISLVKSRSSNRAHINFDDDVEDTTTSGGGGGGKSVGSTKRKGSFKKWLRSSHRKLTSNASNNSSSSSMTARKEIINGGSGAKLLLGSSDSDNLKIKKVLSNSEDLKIKNWLIEEPNNEENEANHLSEQTILENPTAASTTIPSSSSNASTATTTPNRQISQQQQQYQQENQQSTTPVVQQQQTSNGNDQEDQEDTSFIPPPMNVIKPEQSEQNSTSGSFNKIPNQSIDIQKELKLWQSKMENSKKQLGASGSGSGSDQQQQQQQVDSSQAPTQLSPNPTPSMAETKLTYAIKELLTTERDYVTDLSNLIDKFMEGIKRNEIPMPQDMVGKEMIVFGNVQQIYEWHKSTFFPDLEKCLSEPPNYIAQLFIKYENRFQMYVKYCENKPKSEFIVSEYDTYFEELRQKLNQKLNIQDLLIKPIQRIMKYQLMLKEIRKFMDKEHMDCRLMDRAIEITITVPKNADDMMNLGRLQGFEGRITAQGRLLLQDTLLVHDSTSDEQKPTKKNAKSSSSESGGGDKQANKFKERRVFLFQQIIIFSEMVGPANPKSKFTSPKYIFKCDMKVNKLKLEKDDAQLTFTLLDKTPDITPRKIVCLCEDAAKYNNWINQLQDLLDMQNQFLRDLQNPQAAIQKIGSAGSSGSMSSPISSGGGGGGKANHHHKDKDQQHPSSASSSSASSSHHHGIVGQVNDFFKSAFTFSSSSSSNSSGTTAGATSPPLNQQQQQPMSPGVLNNTNHSNRSSGTSIATTPTTISPSLAKQASSGSGGRSNTSLNTASTTTNDHLSSELAQQLTINNNTTTSTNSDSRKNSGSGNGNGNGNTAPGIVLAKCIVSYTAVTEDEISVQKGDVVQIMMANMHNRYMVHREADGQQPAAEGWIPGSVIGSQFSSSSLSSSSSSTAANPISSPPQQLI